MPGSPLGSGQLTQSTYWKLDAAGPIIRTLVNVAALDPGNQLPNVLPLLTIIRTTCAY